MIKAMLFGNNSIAVDSLEILSESNVEICAVVPENIDNGTDGWQKSLKKATNKYGYRILQADKLTDKNFIQSVEEINPDIIFSVQCRRILKRELINIPKHGVINLHLSLLPKYRGCYPITWALINGEKYSGATLHYIDEGIDTGDIIAQKEFEISERDNGRIVFEKASSCGVELFKENIDKIIGLNNKRIKQDEKFALYYPFNSIDFKKNEIDWNTNFITLFNWIKAFIFEPFQYPFFLYKGKKIEILSVKSYNNLDFQKPGDIVKIDDCLTISAIGGNIVIDKIKYNNNEISSTKLKDLFK